jgi:hypothetical protein
MVTREEIRQRIDSNIRERGWHYYSILPGPVPAWNYTIGLTETVGVPELVMAGRGVLSDDEVSHAFERLVAASGGVADEVGSAARELGLRLGPVHHSWRRRLLLGAEERYGEAYEALQLVPDGPGTIDVPDLAQRFSARSAPAWRWLDEPWPYADPPFAVRRDSLVLTDLEALAGQPLHEVARVGSPGLDWECWAATMDPIPPSMQRIIPLGVLLAVDPTIEELLDLDEGEWATRSSPTATWEKWSA